MIIPHRSLSPDALRGVIEAFVTREGADYGVQDVPLVTFQIKQRCFGQIIWRSNEPQVRTPGVGGHYREETFLGKAEQANPRYYKGWSAP
jgi:uncharacterized protein YheU (UPF0270 family)